MTGGRRVVDVGECYGVSVGGVRFIDLFLIVIAAATLVGFLTNILDTQLSKAVALLKILIFQITLFILFELSGFSSLI